MTIQETIKTIDEPKGWLKITPSDIRCLNDYCKKLESENQQLILSGVSHRRELLIGALEEYNKVKYEWNKLTYEDYLNEYHPNL